MLLDYGHRDLLIGQPSASASESISVSCHWQRPSSASLGRADRSARTARADKSKDLFIGRPSSCPDLPRYYCDSGHSVRIAGPALFLSPKEPGFRAWLCRSWRRARPKNWAPSASKTTWGRQSPPNGPNRSTIWPMARTAETHGPGMIFYGLAMMVFGVVRAAQHRLHFALLVAIIFGALLIAWGAYSWATGRARGRPRIGVSLSMIGCLAAAGLWMQVGVDRVLLEFWLVFGAFVLAVLLAHYPLGRRSAPTKN